MMDAATQVVGLVALTIVLGFLRWCVGQLGGKLDKIDTTIHASTATFDARLDGHDKILGAQTNVLEQQSRTLAEQGETLRGHTKALARIVARSDETHTKVAELVERARAPIA